MNSLQDARNSMDALRRLLRDNDLLEFNSHPVKVHLAYNPTHLAGIGDSITTVLQKALDNFNAVSSLDYDAKEMIADMHRDVHEGRILMVPHSQGNFYANAIFLWLAERQDGVSTSSMSMYNVASPTHLAATNANYILSSSDAVIAGLVAGVGAIPPPNAFFKIGSDAPDKLGHSFVESYLRNAGPRIAGDIRAQLAKLADDESKDADIDCVPAPETGFGHAAEKAVFSLLDPASEWIAGGVKGGISAIASVFGSSHAPVVSTRFADVHVVDIPAPQQPAGQSIAITHDAVMASTPVVQLKTVPSIASTPLPPDETIGKIAALQTRIDGLKQLLALLADKPKSDAQGSGAGGGSGATGANATNKPAVVASGTVPALDTLALASSTKTETLIFAPKHDTFYWEPDHTVPGANVTMRNPENRLMISEYYLATSTEATWVELYNASDDWIDTRATDFVDDGHEAAFPVASMAPHEFLVLKTAGAFVQDEPATTTRYNAFGSYDSFGNHSARVRIIEGLRDAPRVEGKFALRYASKEIDIAPFGPSYCASDYALSRSCERMIALFPGDQPGYWVRSRGKDLNVADPFASSIGTANPSWGYRFLDGHDLRSAYPTTAIPRDTNFGVYIGGMTVPAGEHVDVNGEWFFYKNDAQLYGDGPRSNIRVNGTLHLYNGTSGLIEPSYSTYIRVMNGGVFEQNPYSTLQMQVVNMGGVVRTNTIDPLIYQSGGKYYTMDYDDGTSHGPQTCASLRESGQLRQRWLGGKIYVAGKDCGSPDDGSVDVGPDDDFGVIVVPECATGTHAYPDHDGNYACIADPAPIVPPTPATSSPTYSATDTPLIIVVPSSTSGSTTRPNEGQTDATSTLPSGTASSSVTSTAEVDASTTPATVASSSAPSSSSTVASSSETSTEGQTAATGSSTPSGATATSSPFQTDAASSTPSGSMGETNFASSSAASSSDMTIVASSSASTTMPEWGLTENPTSSSSATTSEPVEPPAQPAPLPHPTAFPLPDMVVNRSAPGHVAITEYKLDTSGNLEWFIIENLMNAGYVDTGLLDMDIAGTRLAFPALSMPQRMYAVLSLSGAPDAPEHVALKGTPPYPWVSMTSSRFFTAVGMPVARVGDTIRLTYTNLYTVWGTTISDVDSLTLSASCPGETTSYGSCRLDKPRLVWNDAWNDGYLY